MVDRDDDFYESDDEMSDHELPEEDAWDDDSSETVPCLLCGADIYEDAVRCPHCGEYVTEQTNVWSGRPTWWILLGLLGIMALVLALLGM
jgi:hypothetical protein